jgi:hypothetical protein
VSEKERDVVALVRMLDYARREAQRLGFGDCARMMDLPIAAIRSDPDSRSGSAMSSEPEGLEDLSRGSAH